MTGNHTSVRRLVKFAAAATAAIALVLTGTAGAAGAGTHSRPSVTAGPPRCC
jgi:hypothetical protein